MDKKFVWIGAGSATNPHFSFDDFDSIVLVEARKEACDELNEHFKDNVKVKTKQVCITDRNGESEFFQCNVEELSALAKPAQLNSLYPGLKVKSYDVDTVSITDFLKEEIVDGGIELFIDTPATSWVLVRELSKSKFLDSITKLHVSIGTVPALYEESADLTELASLLRPKCFDEISRNFDDPDIPVVSFKSNESLKAVESLKAENSDLKQQLIELTQHNEESKHTVNKLNSELAEKSELIKAKSIEIQALDTEIAKYKADFKKKSLDCDELCNQLEVSKSINLVIENKLTEEQVKVTKLTKELEEQTNKLKITLEALQLSKESEHNKSTELKNSQSKLDTLTNELSQLRLSVDQREREFEANEEKIAELIALLDSQKADLQKQYEVNSELTAQNKKISEERDKEHNWHMENKQWAEGLASSQSSIEAKYQDANSKLTSLQEKYDKQERALSDSLSKEKNLASALSINTKLMKKLEVDLNDLRLKYEEKKTAEAELKKLVSDLYVKLQQAASFYHKLEQQYPELVIENMESEK